MENKVSLQYLIALKEKSRDRYQGKPCKPRRQAAQAKKGRSAPIPEEVMGDLHLQASIQIMGKIGKGQRPYVPETEDQLNEAWRIVLLGWASLEYFKKALDKWERITGGNDNGTVQETLKF